MEPKKQPRVLVFSTPTCGYCSKAKRFLKQSGVKFRDIDISKDPDASRDVKRISGGTSVPVIMVGSTVVTGFDKSRLERLLGLKKKPEAEDEGEG
jgi:glutaredoxin-like YruB-family protein